MYIEHEKNEKSSNPVMCRQLSTIKLVSKSRVSSASSISFVAFSEPTSEEMDSALMQEKR